MVDMSRVLSQQLWSGSPVGATPGNREFPGLENQIATGQVDAVTGTAMPAADSLVLDFGGDDVCGGGRDIVQYMTQADQSLRHIASRTGVDATWAICMHPDLWFDFTECWPCIYLTNRCSNIGAQNAEARLVVEAEANRLLRDEMRRSMTIDINGNIYPVITDDGISNSGTTGLTERSSSIFFVPLTVNRIEATRLEYLDMRVATMLPTSVNRRQDFWTNEGFYIWVLDQNMTCIKVVGRTEARVVLRTPWLAARIDDITYDPLRLLRPPYPGASGFVDGGASSVSFPQSVPGQDAVWAS